jgi:hypothetical protein
MKTTRFTDEQIIGFLKQAEAIIYGSVETSAAES